ncbi:MAG TPA: hypothetical protein VN626_00390 [Clostridia bacterium]|nr:hypothetical protein [Clostridia bacterium]
MADKPLKVLLTFKQSEKWLYDEICSHSGKGNWVKDILAGYLRGQKKEDSGGIKDELL